ncbi:hypothetical protein [Longimicrobium sp.]|jgi:hypothetical protein
MKERVIDGIDDVVIEPLTDDLLAKVAGASSWGAQCCSCYSCSNPGPSPT